MGEGDSAGLPVSIRRKYRQHNLRSMRRVVVDGVGAELIGSVEFKKSPSVTREAPLAISTRTRFLLRKR